MLVCHCVPVSMSSLLSVCSCCVVRSSWCAKGIPSSRTRPHGASHWSHQSWIEWAPRRPPSSISPTLANSYSFLPPSFLPPSSHPKETRFLPGGFSQSWKTTEKDKINFWYSWIFTKYLHICNWIEIESRLNWDWIEIESTNMNWIRIESSIQSQHSSMCILCNILLFSLFGHIVKQIFTDLNGISNRNFATGFPFDLIPFVHLISRWKFHLIIVKCLNSHLNFKDIEETISSCSETFQIRIRRC